MRICDFETGSLGRIASKYLIFLFVVPVGALLLLRLSLSDLYFPLSNGDLLNTYKMQETFWQHRSFSNPKSGYPIGMDTRVWPYLDPLPSALTGIFFLFTNNIILSVNLVFIFSFSICALVVWKISTEIGMSKTWKSLTVIMCVSIPWIPGRVEHFDFTYISLSLLPLAIYLRKSSNNRDIVSMSIAGIACGLTNPYLAVFAALNLTLAGAHYLLTRGIGKKTIQILFGITSCFVGMIASLAISTYGYKGEIFPGFHRSLNESVNLAGYIFVLLSPVEGTQSGVISSVLPSSNLLGIEKEPTMKSNFGSWLLAAAFIVIIVLACRIYMAKLEISNSTETVNKNKKELLYLFLFLIAGNTIFFLKGGIGILLSASGFSFIRSWNRLTPIIQTLIIIAAVFFIQNWTNWGRKFWFRVALSILLISQLQAFTTLSPNPKKQQQIEAQNYVNQISIFVKPPCGILQGPQISYPQNGNYFKMHDYDPFILQLTRNDFEWSYGNPKNSQISSKIQIDEMNNSSLQAKRFCGVSLDTFGTNSDEIYKKLVEIYGEPSVLSSSKRYVFFMVLGESFETTR